jgi:hypothetical protein
MATVTLVAAIRDPGLCAVAMQNRSPTPTYYARANMHLGLLREVKSSGTAHRLALFHYGIVTVITALQKLSNNKHKYASVHCSPFLQFVRPLE